MLNIIVIFYLVCHLLENVGPIYTVLAEQELNVYLPLISCIDFSDILLSLNIILYVRLGRIKVN